MSMAKLSPLFQLYYCMKTKFNQPKEAANDTVEKTLNMNDKKTTNHKTVNRDNGCGFSNNEESQDINLTLM